MHLELTFFFMLRKRASYPFFFFLLVFTSESCNAALTRFIAFTNEKKKGNLVQINCVLMYQVLFITLNTSTLCNNSDTRAAVLDTPALESVSLLPFSEFGHLIHSQSAETRPTCLPFHIYIYWCLFVIFSIASIIII